MTWKRCGGWVSQNRRSFADGETPFFCSKLPVACFFTEQWRMKAPTKRYSSNMKDGESQFRKNECNFQQDWPPLVINGVGTPINGRRWMGFPGLNSTSFFSGVIFFPTFLTGFWGPILYQALDVTLPWNSHFGENGCLEYNFLPFWGKFRLFSVVFAVTFRSCALLTSNISTIHIRRRWFPPAFLRWGFVRFSLEGRCRLIPPKKEDWTLLWWFLGVTGMGPILYHVSDVRGSGPSPPKLSQDTKFFHGFCCRAAWWLSSRPSRRNRRWRHNQKWGCKISIVCIYSW